MKTNTAALEGLFDALATTMKEQLTADPSASTMNVIRQFLKDQGIQARAAKGSPLGNLVGSLPQFSDDDVEDNHFSN